MADYYQQFSESILALTKDEQAWVRGVLTTNDDPETTKTTLKENGIDCQAIEYPEYWPDFQWVIDADGLWLYSDEHGDLEQVAEFVRAFLARFRPNQCWSLTWSSTCSKPRIGEFGGGALFVTAKQVRFQNAHQFIDQQRERFRRKARRSR